MFALHPCLYRQSFARSKFIARNSIVVRSNFEYIETTSLPDCVKAQNSSTFALEHLATASVKQYSHKGIRQWWKTPWSSCSTGNKIPSTNPWLVGLAWRNKLQSECTGSSLYRHSEYRFTVRYTILDELLQQRSTLK